MKFKKKILNNISNLYFNIRYSIQRAKKGYDEKEVSDIDTSFVNRYISILKEFKDSSSSHPGSITMEEWNNILEEMINDLEMIKFNDDTEQNMKYKDNFFSLFSKWFFYLWN